MSNTTYSATDFLDDDGNVDKSKILGARNRHADHGRVSPKECAEARRLIGSGLTSHEVADRLNISPDAVQKHCRGKCMCAIDEPAYLWDGNTWKQQPTE